MNLMDVGVLMVKYSVLPDSGKKAFLREHPELKNPGMARWALTAATLRGAMGDDEAAERYSRAARDLARELGDYQLAAEAEAVHAGLRGS